MKKQKRSQINNHAYLFWLATGSTLILSLILYKYYQDKASSLSITDIAHGLTPSQSPNLMETLNSLNFTLEVDEQCSQNLQSLKLNSWSTREWLENFKISVTQELTYEPDYLTQAGLLKKAFKEILAEKTYYPNIINPKTFKLMLILQSEMDEHLTLGAFGDYDMLYDTISISYLPKGSLTEYKQHLRNEFFSHQLIFKNLQRDIKVENKFLLATPFLDDSGKLDENKMLQFELILNSCEDRAKDFLKYFNAPQTMPELSKEAEKLQLLAKTYRPFDKIFSTIVKDQNKEVITLLNDIIFMRQIIEKYSVYQKQPKYLQLSELASYYAMFDNDVQLLLFPNLHTFLTQFFCQMPAKNTSNRNENLPKNQQISFSYNAEKLAVDHEKIQWKFHDEARKKQARDQQPTKEKKFKNPKLR